jgi:2-oxoisovalerate dehydrogenase E1 component beta subunit
VAPPRASNEALFAHTPGLRVVACASATDAYELIQQAIASDDPVLFYEPKRRYWDKGDVDLERDPLLDTTGMHRARVLRAGTDCTVVAYGPSVKTALAAAEAAEEDGLSLQVVDLRSISPLDVETLRAAAVATGRMVVVHEASTFLGLGAEIAATITEECFFALEAPVLRVGAYDLPFPPSKVEHDFLPDVDRILDAVERALAY